MVNDDSCVNTDTVDIAARHGSPSANSQGKLAIQQYTLLPNPNDDNMTIRQLIPDLNPVVTEILDAVGRNLYRQNITFSGSNYSLQLGKITPAIYLLQLRVSKGKEFRFKFVVE